MAVTKQKAPKGRLHSLVELAVTVGIAIGVALLIQAFLVKPYKIPTGSMEPTLVPGQHVLVDRLDTSPGIGDIVVFHPPTGADAGVNQVCGDPAEGVLPDDSARNQPCDGPVPAESTQTFIKRVVGLPGDTLRIKDGHVYRNGVREPDSYISQCAPSAPTPCSFAWPITVPSGDYYMMGDNRGYSFDSRFWGPVPQAYIIGVAFLTYWPPDRIGIL
jgi:signal peptidase I